MGLGLGLDWHQTGWTELSASAPGPSPRAGSFAAFDPTGERLIVFGGGADECYNDTWSYDPTANTWTELKPSGPSPSARSGQSMAYDQVSHRLIMFGGTGDTGALNDTWSYDPTANTWTELKPSGTSPSARFEHAMAYDLTSGRLIVFGGLDSALTSLDDAWVYDPAASTWTELEPSGTRPFARAGNVMVYDPVGGRPIMFGGNETWTCALG